jgi:hypothetical protein
MKVVGVSRRTSHESARTTQLDARKLEPKARRRRLSTQLPPDGVARGDRR